MLGNFLMFYGRDFYEDVIEVENYEVRFEKRIFLRDKFLFFNLIINIFFIFNLIIIYIFNI